VLTRRAELRLELELGEVPITGHLTDQQGLRTAFAGWVQLVSLIDQAGAERFGQTAPSDPLPRRNP